MSRELVLQRLLDFAFEAAQDPGQEVLDGSSIRQDLGRIGLLGRLTTEEVATLRTVIGHRCVAFDDLIKELLEVDSLDAVQQKKSLGERIAEEATRRAQSPTSPTSPGAEDLSAVFAVERRLRVVLDKKRCRLVDAYREMDLEGTGAIGKVDFGKGLRRLGVVISRFELDNFFRVVDTNGSGTISFKEFGEVFKYANVARQGKKAKRATTIAVDSTVFVPTLDSLAAVSEPEGPGKIIQTPTHLALVVSGQQFRLQVDDVLARVPTSVLGKLAANHAGASIFCDLCPDTFALIVAACLYDAPVTLQGTRVGVNAHTVRHMCNILGIEPPAELTQPQEHGRNSKGNNKAGHSHKAASKANSTSSKPKHQHSKSKHANHQACACHQTQTHQHGGRGETGDDQAEHSDAARNFFKVSLQRTVASGTDGVELQVRAGETLVVESVLGRGLLTLDVLTGAQDHLQADGMRAAGIVVYDSRAFFPASTYDEPTKLALKVNRPGQAQYYRFKASSPDSKPATITVEFQIVTTFSCSCAVHET